MILSTCAICSSRKSKFIKKQEASGILSSVGIRTPLSQIPILGDIFNSVECNSIENCIKIMLSFCLKCGETTKNFILQVSRTIYSGIIIIISKCAVCGDKKFIKKQEANVLLNNLVIKKLSSKVSILRDILF